MILETHPQLRSLSTEEKMLLASELWEEAADESARSNEDMVELVGDLYKDYLQHPGQVTSWSEIRDRIQNRVRESKGGTDA